MDVTLIGGGWDPSGQRACLMPFLTAAAERADGASRPRIGFVWVDEGDGTDWGARWIALLCGLADLEPMSLATPMGGSFDPGRLDGADAVFVCGGLTPAYAAALAPGSDRIRELVAAGMPYAGSSAGAAVAARHAVVGGYLAGARMVCPDDAGEDLEQVTVVDGLGLVDEMVDVHASAWGTLPRLATALVRAGCDRGVGLDEDTAWHVRGSTVEVLGRNAVHVLNRTGHDLHWETRLPD